MLILLTFILFYFMKDTPLGFVIDVNKNAEKCFKNSVNFLNNQQLQGVWQPKQRDYLCHFSKV